MSKYHIGIFSAIVMASLLCFTPALRAYADDYWTLTVNLNNVPSQIQTVHISINQMNGDVVTSNEPGNDNGLAQSTFSISTSDINLGDSYQVCINAVGSPSNQQCFTHTHAGDPPYTVNIDASNWAGGNNNSQNNSQSQSQSNGNSPPANYQNEAYTPTFGMCGPGQDWYPTGGYTGFCA